MLREKSKVMVLLCFVALLLSGCSSKEPTKSDVEDAITSLFESESNPLSGSYINHEYELKDEYRTENSYKGTYSLSEDSELSRVEMEAIILFSSMDDGWVMEDSSLNVTRVCPFDPPDKAFVEEEMCSRYNVEAPCLDWSLSINKRSWSAENPGTEDTMEVSFTRTCDTYMQTINARLTAQWNESKEKWELGSSGDDYHVMNTEYDFSRINGRWEGIWTNTKEQIPLWFEISDAGTVTVSADESTNNWTTVNLEHNLNEARNNNTDSVFYSQFATGSVQLTVDGSEKEPSIYIRISYPGDSSSMSDTNLGIEATGLAYFDVFRTNLSCVSEREAWPSLEESKPVDDGPAATDNSVADEPSTPANGGDKQGVERFSRKDLICAGIGAAAFIAVVVLGLLLIIKRRKAPLTKQPDTTKPDVVTADEELWLCPRCGEKNSSLHCSRYCGRCGMPRFETYRPEPERYTSEPLSRDAPPTYSKPREAQGSGLKMGKWESTLTYTEKTPAEDTAFFNTPKDL